MDKYSQRIDKWVDFISQIHYTESNEIYTPRHLVEDVLDKLPKSIWTRMDVEFYNPSVKNGIWLACVILRRMHGLRNKIKDPDARFNLVVSQVHGSAATELARRQAIKLIMGEYTDQINIVVEPNPHELEFGDMKFDVVLGNPPYQDSKNNRSPLWQKIYEMSINNLVKDGGYVVTIHPSNWRKPEHKLLDLVKSKDLLYLEMHDTKDAGRVFGVGIRYDITILRNGKYNGSTTIVDDQGVESTIDIQGVPFIPHNNVDTIFGLFADEGERVNMVYSCSYHTQQGIPKGYMSKTKSSKFKYPVVHATRANDVVYVWSSENRGHFGVKKVVAGRSNTCNGCFFDKNGEYGTSQDCFSIVVSSNKEGEGIVKAMKSELFKEITKSMIWSGFAFDFRVLRLFRKDFWKGFI